MTSEDTTSFLNSFAVLISEQRYVRLVMQRGGSTFFGGQKLRCPQICFLISKYLGGDWSRFAIHSLLCSLFHVLVLHHTLTGRTLGGPNTGSIVSGLLLVSSHWK